MPDKYDPVERREEILREAQLRANGDYRQRPLEDRVQALEYEMRMLTRKVEQFQSLYIPCSTRDDIPRVELTPKPVEETKP
jgi:hypothetical protein